MSILFGDKNVLSSALATLVFAAALLGAGTLFNASASAQQQPPAIAYMVPSGCSAGSAVDVVLGGYDWTPDVEVFVHAPGVQLELTGEPSSVIVPEPPYWFGKKARRSPFLMPSETPARLTIPAGLKAGIYRWQVANANGAAATGRFVVSDMRELQEDAERNSPQSLNSLPVIVNGQIRHIEEFDQYRVVAPHDGPITVSLTAAAIGSPLTAAVEIRDADGQLVADAADTAGDDLQLTFAATKDEPYAVGIYDVDFRGNRSFVYRLTVEASPQIVAAIPAGGRRGEIRDVQFIGYGLATGGGQLESITRGVTFPSNNLDAFVRQVETPFGIAESAPLLLSDIPELVDDPQQSGQAQPLSVPSAVTGVLAERYGEDRYIVEGNKGDVWAIDLLAQAIGSKLDVALSVRDSDDKELQRSDDLPETTDAGMEFVVPADGSYQLLVSDSSGRSGNRAATYRLSVRPAVPRFRLKGPEFVNVPLGGKSQLTVNALRAGGFTDPITVHIEGLPAGVTVPDEVVIPAKKNLVKVELSAAADTGTAATPLHVSGRARIGESEVDEQLPPILLAVTMPPPFSIDAEGKNDVTKWPRGTTFPAPVLIERDEGFQGEIVLEMAARQGRHRQGITGPELAVPADVDRILYPVFLPEWLETTRTSRMVVNGVAQVADPKGRVRHLSTKLKTRIGFLPTGALLKINCDLPEIEVAAGEPLTIPLTINRANELTEDVLIELVQDRASDGLLLADPVTVAAEQSQVAFPVTSLLAGDDAGECTVTVRATVLQQGRLPVVSETQVLIAFAPMRR